MKTFLAILLTAVLGFLAGIFLPWWSIALIAFAVALLIPRRLGAAFLSGFAGIFLLWAIIALWIDNQNNHLLSYKIAEVFHLGGSSILMVLVSAFIGGIVGGFAAMAGSSLRPAPGIERKG
jgi:hypothetical protein